jgi:hypothetical protein
MKTTGLPPIKILWQEDSEKNKYRLDKRNVVCRPKYQQGLEVKNRSILGKWGFKHIIQNE